MLKMQKRFFLSLVAVFLCCIGVCQNDTYSNLEDALKNKEIVKTLILKKHKLENFPMGILELENLERLDISRNYIKEIPKEISSLKKLHYLNAAQNYLTCLPKEMASMPIDTLILWDNMIRAFDESFIDSKIKYLDLRAIQMTRKEQKAILRLFPNAKVKKDHPCNCGGRKE